MRYPEFVNKGDVIYVTAPSDGNTEEIDIYRLEKAKDKLSKLGVTVLETPDVRSSLRGRSADAKVRAEEFVNAWNSEAKAVISAKGGDFLMEMLPYVPFEKLADNPKWFQGFSDNTSIGFILSTCYDIASLYCNNFNDFAMKEWHPSIENNWSILTGNIPLQKSFDKYQADFYKGETGTEGYMFSEPVCIKELVKGENTAVSGRLTGGCLDVLLNLVGTKYDKVNEYVNQYKNDGIVWFMESFALGSEDIERGLWQLGEAGWFDNVNGFVFGRYTFFNTTTDTSYEEALLSALSKYNVPIIYGADIGHRPPQFTMVNGAYGTFEYCGGKCSLKTELI